jgi:putative polyhydroxyalkanoate system protein
MSQPIQVDLPHSLGKEEARRRIAANIHKLESQIPGGARVQSRWSGDRLNLQVHAMGQAVTGDLDVEEARVRCKLELPGMLAMFARPIEAMLSARGGDLLLEDKGKR